MIDYYCRDFKDVPAIPPEIKVGDKVRVCKDRWVAEGICDSIDERYLKEGTVVSIMRALNRYSDQERTIYEVYFEPYFTPIEEQFRNHTAVTLRVSYKEIYSHKPTGVNFTYILNRNSSPVVPKMETRQDKFDKMLKLAEKLKSQTDTLKKYSDAMYNNIALLGTDFTVTTVDEAPFISPNMDVASWYPDFMAAVDGDVIGTVKKKEVSDDGVKIYISQPNQCGKDWATKIREALHKQLSVGFLEQHPIIPDEIKTIKNGDNTMKNVDIRVKNIIHNGPCTIVFWMDSTKTVVKLKEGDTYDPYAAFCIAVAKKLYGNNSKISKIVDRFSKDVKVPETMPRELSVEELKAAADKIGYRVSRKPKK